MAPHIRWRQERPLVTVLGHGALKLGSFVLVAPFVTWARFRAKRARHTFPYREPARQPRQPRPWQNN